LNESSIQGKYRAGNLAPSASLPILVDEKRPPPIYNNDPRLVDNSY